MTTNALHIYTVSFKIQLKPPQTGVTYHHYNIVADSAILAQDILERMELKATVTEVKYFGTAIQEVGNA